MGAIVSPGVYTTERDLSLYVPQLSSAIFGVVGTASKGPTDELTLITDEAALIKTFGTPDGVHQAIYAAIQYLRRGRQLKFVRVANYDVAATVDVMGNTADGPTYTNIAATFQAASTGTWGNNLKIKVQESTYHDGAYKISVLENNVVVEVFDNCVVDDANDDNYWVDKINDNSDYVQIDATSVDATQIYLYKTTTAVMSGGDDGATVDSGDIIGVVGTPPAVTPTGLQCFRNAETVDVNILAAPGSSDSGVVAELLSICEDRGDCFAILDGPYGYSVSEIADWHNGIGDDAPDALSSSYGAVYNCWVQIYDGYSNSDVWVAPSGIIAGAIAYNDFVADPWAAPAGLNRGRILSAKQIEYSADQGQRDFLYSGGNAVNPIVSMYGQGIVIWGQRTLQRTTTSLDRINVRRMLLYIRKAIATAVMAMAFEPNDATSWLAFKNLVTPFLDGIKARRGLTDFRVVCDSTTNTPELIRRKEMKANLLLQPTDTAEIITVECVLLANGTSFAEVV